MLCQGWELHPAKCQSHYKWPWAQILFGFCLCKDGPSLECQVVFTLPGFPLGTKLGMKCQIFAAALGWNSLPKPSARPGRMHRAAPGSSVLCSQGWDSKPLSAPGCIQSPHSCVSIRSCGVRAHKGLPCPGLSPHHFHTSTRHRPTAITDTEGRWSLVRERERKGSHPGSFSYTGTVSGSVGRGSNRFTRGRVWPQELFLINLKIHPIKHPQEFQN